MFFKQRPFPEALILLIVVGIINWFALANSWYWAIKEFDSFVHFLGGVCVSLGFIWFYFFSGIFAPTKRSLHNFMTISFMGVLMVSIIWEVYELTTGTTGVSVREYPYDTFIDFVMDILGGVTACFYCYLLELKLVDNKII